MKQKVYFRADASEQIGYGHFIRSLALAEMLKDDYDCTFFTQAPNDYQLAEVRKVCKLDVLPADDSKFGLFLKKLKGEEIVVLDNYFFTSQYEREIKDRGCKLLSIGTNSRHYFADVVVNFTKLTPSDFSSENYTRFCLGLEWTILRKPFYHKDLINKDGIVICIGGTDQFDYSERFYDTIRKAYPNQSVTIIATDRIGQQRIDAFNKQDVDLQLNLTAEQMAFQFAKAEIAVVSASSVALEALTQSANVIAGYYVDNQINIYHALQEDGYIWGIDDFKAKEAKAQLLNSIGGILSGRQKKVFNASDTVNRYKQLFSELCK